MLSVVFYILVEYFGAPQEVKDVLVGYVGESSTKIDGL